MRTRPTDLDEARLHEALSTGWGFDAVGLTYAPVGFGSHHWVAADATGESRFVTVDDLARRRRSPADTTDAVFDRAARTFSGVRALRDVANLAFVVAPLPAADGSLLHRLDDRYSLVVHPLLDAEPVSADGEYSTMADREAVLELVVELHRAGPAALERLARDDGTLPGRVELLDAIERLGDPWDTGPYGEQCRTRLAAHASEVEHLLAAYDRLGAAVLARPERMVVTHGEPHAGNVLVGEDGLLLVDWDTALGAPPERDLWDLDAGDGSILAAYAEATGIELDPDALAFYRLWFDLAEVAGYVALFSSPHLDTADVAESWVNLEHFLRPRERWPALFA